VALSKRIWELSDSEKYALVTKSKTRMSDLLADLGEVLIACDWDNVKVYLRYPELGIGLEHLGDALVVGPENSNSLISGVFAFARGLAVPKSCGHA
jgi:hypothetical protein